MTRGGFDIPAGQIIGGEERLIKAILLNKSGGAIIAETGYVFESDAAAKAWAWDIMQSRKSFWGSEFSKRYPAGAELRMFG